MPREMVFPGETGNGRSGTPSGNAPVSTLGDPGEMVFPGEMVCRGRWFFRGRWLREIASEVRGNAITAHIYNVFFICILDINIAIVVSNYGQEDP